MHAAVAVVVYRAIADVVGIHQIHDICYRLRVVSGVSINFHIEDVASSGQLVVWAFYFCFVAWRAMVVYRHMVGVGVIYLVGNSRYLTETFAVACGEFPGQSFGRSGKHREVVLITL